MSNPTDTSRIGAEPTAKVFISYSRADMLFTDRLDFALRARGFDPLIDRTEIYAFEDWWKRIQALISTADTVIFVLSPDAVSSDICQKEVAFAASLNKRIAPIVCRSVDTASVPETLGRLNFIFFDDESQFEQRADALAEALSTDIEWIRKHTNFGQQAQRWSEAGRPGPRGLLLRPPVLEEAEKWIASRPPNAPTPTEATQAFIIESRRATTRRRRVLSASLGAGLIVAIGLAGLAYWQRGIAVEQETIAQEQRKSAEEQRRIAEEQRRIAEKNEAQAKQERDKALLTQSRFLAERAEQSTTNGDSGTAMLLAIEALPDARAGIDRPYAPEAERASFSAIHRPWDTAVLAPAQNSAQASPDGRHIVTASSDNTARIWDIRTAKPIIVLTGHTDGVNSAAYSADGRRVVTASSDKTARVWDAESGRAIIVLMGHADAVQAAQFSPDGLRVVTVSRDETARIWDVGTGRTVMTLAKHKGSVLSAAFSPDGRRVVTSSDDGTALIWDAKSGQTLKELKNDAAVNAASFSPDGKQIVTASGDTDTSYQVHAARPARIWDAESGRKIIDLVGHAGPVLSAAFNPAGQYVITGSYDHTARYWDGKTGKTLIVMASHSSAVRSVGFSADGRHAVTASEDGTSRVWGSAPGPTTIFLGDSVDDINNAALSPEGQRLVAPSANNTAVIWDIEKRQRIAVLAGHTGAVRFASFSRDGARVVTASEDKSARIWDAGSGKTIATLQGHADAVVSAAFSPNGRWVVTASRDKTARIWDVRSNQTVMTLAGHTDSVVGAEFSVDGRRVITASVDKTARIWGTESRKQQFDLRHSDAVQTAAFSPDGRRVITAFNDDAAVIWDADTGEKIMELKGYYIDSAAFSPDGRRAVTTSWEERSVRIWDIASGRTNMNVPVLPADLLTVHILNATFSSDGRQLVAVVNDGTARIWPVFPTTQSIVDYIKQAIPRCLSREQRVGAFLDPVPPDWCVDMAKWPYDTQDWKDWLRYKRENANPPLADSPEWQSWLAAHQH